MGIPRGIPRIGNWGGWKQVSGRVNFGNLGGREQMPIRKIEGKNPIMINHIWGKTKSINPKKNQNKH